MVFGWFNTSVEVDDDKADELTEWAQETVDGNDSGAREMTVDILGVSYEITVYVEARDSLIPFSRTFGLDYDIRAEVRTDGVKLAERQFDMGLNGPELREWLLAVHAKANVQNVNISGVSI